MHSVVSGVKRFAHACTWRGREQTAEADEVVSVLDIVRIPVVFSMGAEEPVLEANFLVLLCTRGQLVGVMHFLPVQRTVLKVLSFL